jgi:hypothetical protein
VFAFSLTQRRTTQLKRYVWYKTVTKSVKNTWFEESKYYRTYLCCPGSSIFLVGERWHGWKFHEVIEEEVPLEDERGEDAAHERASQPQDQEEHRALAT